MHYCGIIIKPTSMSKQEAREMLGDILVNHEMADYYSTGDLKERIFRNGKAEISLEEFKRIFTEWLNEIKDAKPEDKHFSNDTWPFAVIVDIGEEDYEIKDCILPSGFYEFYDDVESRKILINTWVKAYKKTTKYLIDELMTHVHEYNVTLLNYHS